MLSSKTLNQFKHIFEKILQKKCRVEIDGTWFRTLSACYDISGSTPIPQGAPLELVQP